MKLEESNTQLTASNVAPLAGAGIEIPGWHCGVCACVSPLSQGRELKFHVCAIYFFFRIVAPLAGAGIEILAMYLDKMGAEQSPLSQGRELKYHSCLRIHCVRMSPLSQGRELK